MKKVWIVTESGWEYTTIIRVCNSKEKALEVAKFQLGKYNKNLTTGKIQPFEIKDYNSWIDLYYPFSESSPEYKVEEWNIEK